MNPKPGLAPGFLLFGVDWDSMRLGKAHYHPRSA
jgi:hypothetical protein